MIYPAKHKFLRVAPAAFLLALSAGTASAAFQMRVPLTFTGGASTSTGEPVAFNLAAGECPSNLRFQLGSTGSPSASVVALTSTAVAPYAAWSWTGTENVPFVDISWGSLEVSWDESSYDLGSGPVTVPAYAGSSGQDVAFPVMGAVITSDAITVGGAGWVAGGNKIDPVGTMQAILVAHAGATVDAGGTVRVGGVPVSSRGQFEALLATALAEAPIQVPPVVQEALNSGAAVPAAWVGESQTIGFGLGDIQVTIDGSTPSGIGGGFVINSVTCTPAGG